MPWLRERSDDQLEQGCVILDFPFPTIVEYERDNVDIDVSNQTVIVLTQSCDIAKRKVNNILLCPVFKLQDYVQILRNDGVTNKKIRESVGNMRKNSEYSKFLINYTSLYDINDYLVVDFDSVVSLPIEAVERIASENNTMVLDTPYRERMAQCYAFFYMRIGFNEDINRDKLKDTLGRFLCE